MKKSILILFNFLYANFLLAQITVGSDTTISLCNPTCVTLKANVTQKDTIRFATSYTLDTAIAYNAYPLDSGTRVSVFVNEVKGPFPIGFTFNFFGECYTEFYIGMGWISFSSGQTGTVLTVPIPDSTTNTNTSSMFYGEKKAPLNAVILSWCDLDNSSVSGSGVYYKTYNTAPNRTLAVSWNKMLGPAAFGTTCASTDSNGTNVGMLSCFFNGQIVLHETTNVIENYILNKMVSRLALPPFSVNPNNIQGVPSVEGLHNQDGTQAVVVPGRNSVAWPDTVPTIWKDAVRFTPSGSVASYKLDWYNDTALIASDTSEIEVCPTITTTYTAKVIYACSDTLSDDATVTVSGGTFSVSAVTDTTLCKGKSTILQAKGGTKTSYSWVPATGLNNPDIANPVATPNATTSYILTAYDSVCGSSAKDTVTIIVDTVIKATIVSSEFCPKDSPVNLTASFPNRGIWTGKGITDSLTGTFSPSIVGTGTYIVSYVTTNGVCTDTGTATIAVKSPYNSSIIPTTPFCKYDTPDTLKAATGGGIWKGNGIIDSIAGIFASSVADVGTHSITYVINGGCGSSSSVSVIVDSILDATITPVKPLCITDSSKILIAATTRGTWNGTGITDVNKGIFTPSIAGIGSHTIFYTISNVCGYTDSITILVTDTPSVNVSVLDEKCSGNCDGMAYANVTDDTTLYSYSWSNGESDASVSGLCSGNYTLIIKNTNGCENKKDFIVSTFPSPYADFYIYPIRATIPNTSVAFTDNSSNNANQWNWKFFDRDGVTILDTDNAQNTVFQYPQTIGEYSVQLTVEDTNGCTANTIKEVFIDGEYVLYVPNAFTPNGDGNNDTFFPKGFGISNYKLYIFNRWGELLFESDALQKGWDGTYRNNLVQNGVYIWKIITEEETLDKTKHKYIGHVTVLK